MGHLTESQEYKQVMIQPSSGSLQMQFILLMFNQVEVKLTRCILGWCVGAFLPFPHEILLTRSEQCTFLDLRVSLWGIE